MFGIAILASVFAHPGVYAAPSTFIDHFKTAVWLGAAFSAIGIVAAAALPGRSHLGPEPGSPAHADIPVAVSAD